MAVERQYRWWQQEQVDKFHTLHIPQHCPDDTGCEPMQPTATH